MASVTVDIPEEVLAKLQSGDREADKALRLTTAFSLCKQGRLATSQSRAVSWPNLCGFLGGCRAGANRVVPGQPRRTQGGGYQGTLAVILLAKTQGIIPVARPVIEQLRLNGMYLSDLVMNLALAQVGE